MFLHCSTCFGRHTFVKPEAAITVLELLMMGGVSPETCWAIKKHWNNKFYYIVPFCWFFLWDIKSCMICVSSYARWNGNWKAMKFYKYLYTICKLYNNMQSHTNTVHKITYQYMFILHVTMLKGHPEVNTTLQQWCTNEGINSDTLATSSSRF
jgi:hypothetical protein